jgi:hypothetical protein
VTNLDPELAALGREVATAIARTILASGSVVRCHFLASQFYEALQNKLQRTSRCDYATVGRIAAAVDQCRPIALPNVSPALILAQVNAALAIVEGTNPHEDRNPAGDRPRPILRIIEGGLSRSAAV